MHKYHRTLSLRNTNDDGRLTSGIDLRTDSINSTQVLNAKQFRPCLEGQTRLVDSNDLSLPGAPLQLPGQG